MLIFVLILTFSNPKNSFIVFSASSNNSLPKIMGLGGRNGLKMAQNWQKSYICQTKRTRILIFVPTVLYPHFPTRGTDLLYFQQAPIICYLKFRAQGAKIGSKLAIGYIFQTKRARVLIFVPIPTFPNPRNSFIVLSASSNNLLPREPKGAEKWPKLANGYMFQTVPYLFK